MSTAPVLRARLRKQICSFTIFALGFSLLGVISAPQASALNNYAAQAVSVDAVGRVNESVTATVYTRLAAGVSSSADQVAVGIVGYKRALDSYWTNVNYSSTSFSATQTPASIINSIATYNLKFVAPTLAGIYRLKWCINYSTTPMTHASLISTNNYTDDTRCNFIDIQVGGAPTKAVFSTNDVTAYPISGNGTASARSSVTLFDSAGLLTRLTKSESFTITSTNASLSANYGSPRTQGTGNIPTTSKALTFSGTSGDSDGAYRFILSDQLNQTSQIKGAFETSFGSGDFSDANKAFVFRTNPLTATRYPQQVFTASGSDLNASFASSTDGKLYYWGSMRSPMSGYDYYGLPSLVSKTTNKPIKLDFTPVTGQNNSITVKKILSGSFVLSSDGVVYRNFSSFSSSSGFESLNQDLEPMVFPSLGSVRIVDAAGDLSYLLDSLGRVWKKSFGNFGSTVDYSLLDLSGFGSPKISKFATATAGTVFMLTESGTVLSEGSNENGLLGQNSSGAPTGVGRVSIQDNIVIKDVYAGTDFAYAIAMDGNIWSWGNNRNYQLGKDSTLIPYATSPILAILPVGVTGVIFGVSVNRIAFVSNDSKTVYTTSGTSWYGWNIQTNGYTNVTDIVSISTYYGYSNPYPVRFVVAQSDGKVWSQDDYSYGNCTSDYGYIRSVGQFGAVSTDDSLRYSGIFLQTDSGTSTVNQTFSMKAGETATIQVVQPRTNCYNVDELVYNWDLDGSGNYAVPGTSSLSQTGYQAFNATLNFATAGRKEVRLKLSTPDGLDLVLKFTVGVEARIAPVIDFGETRTGLVSGSNNSALGIGTDGLLYTWGDNSYGQLSTPISSYGYRYLALPVALPNGARPSTVFSYYYNYSYQANFVVDTSGKVWGSGNAYAITGSYGNIETFTALSHLSSYNIVDIQASMYRGFGLTKSGQVLMWQMGTTGNARTPSQIVSLAGINIKNFTVQIDGNSGSRISAIDTNGDLWQVPISNSDVVGDATKITAFSDVRQLSWNGTQATLVTGTGGVWYSVNGASPFAPVSLPVGVTAVDAMYSGTLYLLDSTKKIWTANPSQSGSTVTMSTWTAYAAQANGQASPSDQPIFQHRGSSFISFASGNLLYTGYYGDYPAGRCNVSGTGSYGNRVYSTGQFGAANVVDQISTTASVAIASQNAANFLNGQFFSANPSDAVVIRLVNPRSGCFNGSSQLTAVADTAGTGNYNTVVPLSNEGGGTYSFTLSATAPSSGRKNISVRISTPLGTSSTVTLGLGVFGNETVTAVVPRTNPINTSQAAVFAVASDGFAYGWSTPTDVSYDYNGTTMSFMNMITSTPPRNSGSPTKLEMPGGARVREAVPFTQCCTNNYSRYMFGVLAVDEFGRTWTWGTDAAMQIANGYTYQNTPLTATQIPALVGENVVRLSVSSNGRRALALTSKGIVYQWYSGSNVTPTRVASLAGLKIIDIYTNGNISFALADNGELYAFNGPGYLGGVSATGNAIYDSLASATKVNLPETVTAIMPLSDTQLTSVKSASGKIYVWGILYNDYSGNAIQYLTPVRIDLPSSRTANLVGSIHYSSYSSNVITASDGTWWDITVNSQNQLTYYQRTGVSSAVNTSVRAFAGGAGQAIVLNSGAIYTTNTQIAGTCGPIGTYTRVMSNGQFGSLYKADQVYISVNGNEITRPNTATSVSVTGWSACDGGANITMTADYVGNNVFGDSRTATVSQDGSRATSTFTFTKTQNGPVNMQFKATTAAGLSGTETFFTKVVPAPLPGRQIGISINAGDRYTNSSNVNLSLVWPDGTTTIYVSNDGGFAPGTVSNYDLQYTVPWVLPPQAVIPLPSIVYARFDNDPNTYYFDDIILDAITPVLTYASAR